MKLTRVGRIGKFVFNLPLRLWNDIIADPKTALKQIADNIEEGDEVSVKICDKKKE